jgi:hypothetical protein
MVNYSKYANYVETICQSGDLSSFKSHPNYTYMLEHVSKTQGDEYLQYIKTSTNINDDEIKNFCKINDSIGSPLKSDFEIVIASPSSLRYIFHSHLILKHLSSLNLPSIDIVEVGGGYGGLCLAINHFSEKYGLKINSYTIVDLPSISKLQNLYLNSVSTLKVDTVDATTFGEGISKQNMFLVSNYCFSEISREFQKKYIDTLFPKISHGFMAWNNIPTYYFGFEFKEEVEYPKTGNFNRYVYF